MLERPCVYSTIDGSPTCRFGVTGGQNLTPDSHPARNPTRGSPLPGGESPSLLPGEAPWEPQGESPPPRGGGGMVYISIAVFPSVYSLLPTTLIENRIIRYRTIVSASIWTRFIRRKYSTMLPYRREKNYIVILLLKSYRQVRENHGNRSNRYPKS